ncbi:MAG: peptidoglycan editing factor PgeF [Candidatus Promineifilaceae bacterium]
MKFQKQDGVPFLRFESFPNDGRIRHAIFTRQGGVSPAPYDSLNLSVSVNDDHANVFSNRAKAYSTHGRRNETLVHAHLKHGAVVAQVSHRNDGEYVGPADGIISNEPGCGLTMNYADCSPILLFDPEHQAIGLGHAGWKGAVVDLPGALMLAMQEAFGSQPSAIIAAIGPSIGPCCYQVGEPVLSAVRASFDEVESLLLPDNDGDPHQYARRLFDLPEANRRRLTAAGVEHIEMAGLCTACRSDLFFSHRADDGRTGRFGALVILGD